MVKIIEKLCCCVRAKPVCISTQIQHENVVLKTEKGGGFFFIICYEMWLVLNKVNSRNLEPATKHFSVLLLFLLFVSVPHKPGKYSLEDKHGFIFWVSDVPVVISNNSSWQLHCLYLAPGDTTPISKQFLSFPQWFYYFPNQWNECQLS